MLDIHRTLLDSTPYGNHIRLRAEVLHVRTRVAPCSGYDHPEILIRQGVPLSTQLLLLRDYAYLLRTAFTVGEGDVELLLKASADCVVQLLGSICGADEEDSIIPVSVGTLKLYH